MDVTMVASIVDVSPMTPAAVTSTPVVSTVNNNSLMTSSHVQLLSRIPESVNATSPHSVAISAANSPPQPNYQQQQTAGSHNPTPPSAPPTPGR